MTIHSRRIAARFGTFALAFALAGTLAGCGRKAGELSSTSTGALNGTDAAATPQGPGPITNGQVENLASGSGTSGDHVAGAIHTVVAHPVDANRLVIGAVNGGIWTTENALTNPPTWVPRTNTQRSQSIGALASDPATPARLVAGFGRVSSFSRVSGELAGVIFSPDFGETWSVVDVDPASPATPVGRNIWGAALRGDVVLVADRAAGGVGIIRSEDGGANWAPVTDLPTGAVLDLAADPADSARFYAAVEQEGIFTSDDTGATWVPATGPTACPVTSPCFENLLFQTMTATGVDKLHAEIAVGSAGRAYVVAIESGQPRYFGYTDDFGQAWTAMDIPRIPIKESSKIVSATNDGSPIVITTQDAHGLAGGDQERIHIEGVAGNTAANGDFRFTVPAGGDGKSLVLTECVTFPGCPIVGNGAYVDSEGTVLLYTDTSPREKTMPGGQGAIHISIVVDPNDQEIVYLGGDRQGPLGSASVIGASDFTGNLWRGDAGTGASGTLPGTSPGPNGNVPSPQWKHLTHDILTGAGVPPELVGGGTLAGSAPHADSRRMVFDADDNLIEVDDGGIYRRTSPTTNQGDWWSLNGNLQITELHNIAFDPVSSQLIGGTQDVGNPQQIGNVNTPGDVVWFDFARGDGADVQVDTTTYSALNLSVRYTSADRYRSRRRCKFNSLGEPVDETGTVVPLDSLDNCETPTLKLRCAPTPTCSGSALVCTPAECPGADCECPATETCDAACDGTTNPIDASPTAFPFVTNLALNQASQRLVIVATNSLYESLNGGDVIFQVRDAAGNPAGASGDNTPLIAGHPADSELIYEGGSSFRLRTTATGTLDPSAFQPPGGTVSAIDVDAVDPAIVFVATNNRVATTSDAGTTAWTNLTGDLYDARQPVAAGTLRAIKFVPGAPSRLFVGSSAGIFVMATNTPGFWNQLRPTNAPDGLPNVLISELLHDSAGDRLFVGSMGRGAWSIASPGSINLPPAARCADVPLEADAMCVASVTLDEIDDGSSDPEGATLDRNLSSTGPFILGPTDVTLTVSDQTHSETCIATVTVVDVTPPVFVETALPPVRVTRCDLSEQSVTLVEPQAIDNCSVGAEVNVFGTIIASDNPSVPVGTVFTGGTVTLPAGTYTVEWTAVDEANNATSGATSLTQEVTVQPSLFAAQSIFVRHASLVRTAGTLAPASLANLSGQTSIENDVLVGNVLSVPSVAIGDRTTAGDVTSGGSITLGSLSTATSLTPGASVSLPDPLNLAGVTPPSGTATVVFGPATLPPGAYGATTVNSGDRLTLGAGVYSFTALTVNAAAILRATDETVIYVGGGGHLQSSFVTATGTLAKVYLGHFGTAVQMSADFTGTLVAPNAYVNLGTGAAQKFSGIIHAKTIDLRNNAEFQCLPLSCPVSVCGGETDTCSNGVQDGDELGVDCGGSCAEQCQSGCSVGVYEAETMFHSAGGTYTGGWNLHSNGYASTTHTFDAGPALVSVRALGEQAQGVLPHMIVAVGGVVIGDATVTTGGFADYTFAFNATGGPQEVRVTFDNDFYAPPSDRNLILDHVVAACAPVFQMSGNVVSMEAEAFHGTTQNGSSDSWSDSSNAQASAGLAMLIGPDSGTMWTSSVSSSAPRLDFNVNFTTSGTFYMHVRADAPNGAGDSCYGGVDGSVNTSHYDFPDNPATWGWITKPIVIGAAGTHTVHLWSREDGLRADKIVIDANPAPPVGSGPPQSMEL
jgi:hypothetical protein